MLNIVLHEPQIPPNTGNIARLCVAMGARLHLIHPLGFTTDEAQMRRAGLDYWKFLDWIQHESWKMFFDKHSRCRLHFYSKKATRPYTEARYEKDDFLIFGSETKGLPEEILARHQDQTWTIPMWGPTRSINLATSVGIVAYEALRQITDGFKDETWSGDL